MTDFNQDYQAVAQQLLDYVEEGQTDQAPEVMRVPSSSYTDAARWRTEMDRIYFQVPLLAALSIELPAPGDYKALDYIGRPILLTRLKDGSVRAMLNVCSHRAMMVVPEGCGNRSRFSCPYHGWTFANDGRLVGIADKGKFGDVERDSLNLTALPVYEAAGLIFVVLTPNATIDFEKFFDGALEDIEQIKIADAHLCGVREILGANWKVAYDGYLEGYHFAAAHPDTIHPRNVCNVMQYHAFGPHLRIGFAQQTIAEQLRAVPKENWGRRENYGYDFVRTLFPNVSIYAAPELIQISQIVPGPGPEQNRTVMYFASRSAPKSPEESTKLENMVNFLKEVVEREDFGVGLKVQRGLDSGSFKNVVFGRNERGNQYFHRWVGYMVDGMAGPPPVL